MSGVYHEVLPISREAAASAFSSGDADRICHALISLAYHDGDWRWVQDTCLHFLRNDNPQISGVAATCLGHVARIHGILDKDKVVLALHTRLADHRIKGIIEDALEDIGMFA
jgi:hypothetical protein